eukprot:scaffold32022_cov62-Phaeocystis_antarctica.AAC.2
MSATTVALGASSLAAPPCSSRASEPSASIMATSTGSLIDRSSRLPAASALSAAPRTRMPAAAAAAAAACCSSTCRNTCVSTGSGLISSASA